MLILRLLFLIVLLFLLAPFSGHAISVSQSLDKSAIDFEDSARFEIVIEWNGPQNANIFGRPLDPFFDRLKVGGFSSSISSTGTGADEVTTKRFRYILIPTSSGNGKIDPITISYISMPDSIPGELLTEPMTITIAEPLPVELSDDGNKTLYLVVLGALVLVGGGAGLYIWRAGRKPKEPVRSPREQFLDGLDDLKKKVGQDFKMFQSGLCDLLESYFESAHGITPGTINDDELNEQVSKLLLSEHQKASLCDWLINARRDKFRPFTAAPGETIRLENEIRELFSNL